MKGQIEILPGPAEFVHRSAAKIIGLLNGEIRSRGIVSLSLSGGNTPRSVYECIATEEFRSRVDWRRVHLFWGDERCVPPSRPESNFRMANEVLIGKISIPESNVHRIPAERTPREASLAYEDELRRHFGIKRDQFPRFDIILLGLGEDGHTASLFPRSPALWEKERLVIDTYVDTIGSHRITLTLPVINNAAQLLFLVSGKGKADIVQQVFEDHKVRYPAQMVKPVSGSLCWLVDTDAASQLEIVHHR